MNSNLNLANIASWAFGFLILIVGVLNLILVHWVPGIAYMLLSLIYFNTGGNVYSSTLGLIPGYVNVILAVIVVFFTLGVSDLGDMIDNLLI